MTKQKVLFSFDPKNFPLTLTNPPEKVFVRGSFNMWAQDKDPSLQLKKTSQGLWELTRELQGLDVPGNSGRPEYKFYYQDKNGLLQNPQALYLKKGFSMLDNNLILYPEDDPLFFEKEAAFAQQELTLKDFNLTSQEDRLKMANIRLVPGTKNLWRGYHTYKKSRNTQTEEPRLSIVKDFLSSQKIQSIITLSGKEPPIPQEESICPWEQKIITSGNELFLDTSYETVYYKSKSQEFLKVIEQIIDFISCHPAPFYIHCRLGSDRTGVTCAVLAALCGANWEAISKDYHKTSFMGLKEYRSPELLKYSFEQLLGKKLDQVTDLQKEITKSLSVNYTYDNLAKSVKKLYNDKN